MKRLWASISIIGVFLFIAAGIANATTIGFGDSVKYWPGWANGSSDDSKDTIGTPDILGGHVDIDGGYLRSVSISYKNTFNAGRYDVSLEAGDLFIDLVANDGSYGDWDYVVDTSSGNTYSFTPGQFALGDGSCYVYSNTTWGYSGWNIRDNHPVNYDNTSLGVNSLPGDPLTILPFNYTDTSSLLTFSYSGLNLPLNAFNGEYSFIMGWTVSCANDVIYENVATPVPAPTTILLVGSGLLGLVAFVRKRKML